MIEPWWHRAVIYQVYPRSFQDSDDDGVGDLRGITTRLEYLARLGVDAIWISPIYPSPMADFGYDVADYTDIDPLFGTLADLDAVLAQAHALGLKVLLDFVPNHTSDQHPWFVESRASRDDAKRDWYIWHDAGPDGGPPNNWISDFGDSAWAWDEHTGQYYYHAFLKEQPDLNWRNAEVRAAMLDVLRFWFERGVDGFRIDVLWHLVKDARFHDNPPNPDYHEGMGEMHRVLQLNSTDQPEVHDIAADMRAVAEEYGGRLLIGEIYLPVERLVRYYGVDRPEVQLPFNFLLVETAWDAMTLGAMISRYQAALPADGWPNWVLGNHDRPRIASRVGEAQARCAAMLLLTLRGTPTIYYGDELGMLDATIPQDRVRDPRELREPGLELGRDPVRTPMAWDWSAGHGFTHGEPWLPFGDDTDRHNVAAQDHDGGSMLALYRRLLALRREHPALSIGDFALVRADDGVLAYERCYAGECFTVALNLTDVPRPLSKPGTDTATCLLTTTGVWCADALEPNQGVILHAVS